MKSVGQHPGTLRWVTKYGENPSTVVQGLLFCTCLAYLLVVQPLR